MLSELSRLSGDETVLQDALQLFSQAPASVRAELAELAEIAHGVKKRLPGVSLGFDLCELRGYEYHTGIVFRGVIPRATGRSVAQGGRVQRYWCSLRQCASGLPGLTPISRSSHG